MESRYGYCQCGCGQKTKISLQNHTKHGWIKGEPLKYINGHNRNGKKGSCATVGRVVFGTIVVT